MSPAGSQVRGMHKYRSMTVWQRSHALVLIALRATDAAGGVSAKAAKGSATLRPRTRASRRRSTRVFIGRSSPCLLAEA